MPHPQGHSHAVDLVRQIAAMNRGEFVDGEVEECHHSKFSIGVAGYPEGHEESPRPKPDIAAPQGEDLTPGAGYIVTQLFYDNAAFSTSCAAPQSGIAVRSSPASNPSRHCAPDAAAADLRLPHSRRAGTRSPAPPGGPKAIREVGTEWAVAQSRELKQAGVPVLHYYPMGKADNIIKIAKAIF